MDEVAATAAISPPDIVRPPNHGPVLRAVRENNDTLSLMKAPTDKNDYSRQCNEKLKEPRLTC